MRQYQYKRLNKANTQNMVKVDKHQCDQIGLLFNIPDHYFLQKVAQSFGVWGLF